MGVTEKAFFNVLAGRGKYDVLPEAFYEEVLQETKIDNLQPGSFIIDMGCGSGAWGIRLSKRNYTVTGIDISNRMVKNALCLAKGRQVEFLGVCGDCSILPFRGNSVNCVFFGFSLHHIPNVSSALQEAHRCLKSKGIIVLAEPNGSNPVRKLSSVLAHAILNRTKLGCYSTENERPLGIDLTYKLLESHGFSLIHVFIDYTILESEKSNAFMALRDLALKVIAKLLPKSFGGTNFVILAKKAEQ